MERKGIIERRNEKTKSRGKPFPKGHKKGSHAIKEEFASGRDTSNEGRVITSTPQELNNEPLKDDSGIQFQLLPQSTATLIKNIKEAMDNTQETKEKMPKDLELIESIDFVNGPNKLSLRFSKKLNRMYRIQVILNDEHEVRPVTYSGTSTGTTFWNLLKGVLKK